MRVQSFTCWYKCRKSNRSTAFAVVMLGLAALSLFNHAQRKKTNPGPGRSGQEGWTGSAAADPVWKWETVPACRENKATCAGHVTVFISMPELNNRHGSMRSELSPTDLFTASVPGRSDTPGSEWKRTTEKEQSSDLTYDTECRL